MHGHNDVGVEGTWAPFALDLMNAASGSVGTTALHVESPRPTRRTPLRMVEVDA